MVVTVTTAATAVSVGGMGPSVVATLGRRPVVTPGVGWVGSGYVVDWLAGKIGPQRLVASKSSPLVVVRGRGRVTDSGVDDWRGGDHPGVHTGSTSVVGHVGSNVMVQMLERGDAL